MVMVALSVSGSRYSLFALDIVLLCCCSSSVPGRRQVSFRNLRFGGGEVACRESAREMINCHVEVVTRDGDVRGANIKQSL